MRTKTLILTAALGLVGIATSVAQVYSVNAVGYVNVAVPVGFSMIANPLDAGTGNNVVSKLFASVPEGTTIYKFNSTTGSYSINTFEFGEWGNAAETMAPGDGAFIKNTTAAAFTVTFVGEVMQGNLSNPIPAGLSIKSSMVPQSGKLDADLKFPVAEGDTVYQFNNSKNGYDLATFEFGEWAAPVPKVGESFFVKKAAAADWTRTFSVNN